MLTRRGFLGGLAATGALSGCRVPSAVSRCCSWGEPSPRLRFGVLSDIHVRLSPDRNGCAEGFGTEGLIRALEWFDAQQADAVVIAGDLADNGLIDEWQAVADAWEWVFPNGRSRDGRTVERLFICGNHDNDLGGVYADYARRIYPTAAEFARHLIASDVAGNWERIFHEQYEPISLKTVRGYPFVLAHWAPRSGGVAGVMAFYARHRDLLGAAEPFFHVQHPHPKNTCHGPQACGHDGGETTQVLSAFPNAVAFSGHSHYSLTDERAIWQGEFTSVGASSLRRVAVPREAHAPFGYENTPAHDGSREIFDPMKLSPCLDTAGCEQGLMVSVYDDHLTVARHEFVTGLSLGPDWVVPLPARPGSPLSFAAHEGTLPAPAFPAGAKMRIRPVSAVCRSGRTERAFEITVPPANVAVGARCHEMEFTVETEDFVRKSKHVLAPDFHLPAEHRLSGRDVSCRFAVREMPAGYSKLRLTVTPRNCFGRSGTSLTATIG